MPLYAYGCEKCDHEFDEVMPIDNRDLPLGQSCPSCGETGGVQRKLSSPRIVSGVGDFRRNVPDVFKDRLREIKKAAGRTSTIDV
jgi:putative FmdB family regulatory protein